MTQLRRVEFQKKPMDLRGSEREERGYGEGVSTEDVRESVLWYDVVCWRHSGRIAKAVDRQRWRAAFREWLSVMFQKKIKPYPSCV